MGKLKKSPGLSRLLGVIDLQIEINPVVKYSLQWCGLPQAELAERAQVTVRTIRRLARPPLIQFHVCEIDGVKLTLYRRADGQSSEQLDSIVAARAMAKEWKRITGNKPSPPEFGCLLGLAEQWPPHSRLKIFRQSIEHWGDFMSAHKIDKATDPEQADKWKPRYLKFPNIRMLREGHKVAVDLYIMALQESGQMEPGEGL